MALSQVASTIAVRVVNHTKFLPVIIMLLDTLSLVVLFCLHLLANDSVFLVRMLRYSRTKVLGT